MRNPLSRPLISMRSYDQWKTEPPEEVSRCEYPCIWSRPVRDPDEGYMTTTDDVCEYLCTREIETRTGTIDIYWCTEPDMMVDMEPMTEKEARGNG